MKKVLSITLIALAIVAMSFTTTSREKLAADYRIIDMCGFSTQDAAFQWAGQNVLVNPDEEVTDVHIDGQPGWWCITVIVTCKGN